MTTYDYVLYYRVDCPYCQRVLRYMHDNDITVELKDTLNDENRAALIEIGGKPQVPCLIIDGEPLYESMDIIEFLKNKTAA